VSNAELTEYPLNISEYGKKLVVLGRNGDAINILIKTNKHAKKRRI
jgi:hypothetical protein